MKPSEFPEVAEHAHLRDFLSRHFDMQVEDVRSMLRLPIEEQGLNGGCNFAAVNILSDLVAGCSVLFYCSSIEGLTTPGDPARPRRRHRRRRGSLAGVHPQPCRTRPRRSEARQLGRASRPRRRDRRDAPWRLVAALSDALHAQPAHPRPQERPVVRRDDGQDDLCPTRRGDRARAAGPDR